jgi:cytochrome b561
LSRDVADYSENPPKVYNRTTIALHWATAILVAIQFLIGRTTNFLPRGPLRVDIWSMHVLFGFALAGVVVLGMLWRATRGRRLPSLNRGILYLTAVAMHRLLDLLLLLIIWSHWASPMYLRMVFRCSTFGTFRNRRSRILAQRQCMARIDRKYHCHRGAASFRSRAFPSPCDQGRGFAPDVAHLD